MPPASPNEIARKLYDMLKRRRPDLSELVEAMSSSKDGLRELSAAFSAAYEAYIRSLKLEDAFNVLVEALEGSGTPEYQQEDLYDE